MSDVTRTYLRELGAMPGVTPLNDRAAEHLPGRRSACSTCRETYPAGRACAHPERAARATGGASC